MEDALKQKELAAGKSAIWYTAATFITKGLGFITIPLFTRIMTTEEFGLFNNFAAWQSILLSVLSLESYATLNRARLDYEGKELQDYQFTLLTSGLGLTFLVALILVVAPAILEALTDLDRKYLYVLVFYLLFYPAFTMFQMLQRVQYKYKLSAGLSLGASLLATGLSVYLVITLDGALMGRVVGQYVPFAVLGMLFYLWYWRTGGSFKLSYLRYALPLAVPLVVSTLGSQVLLLGCRIVTQHTCGADEVAFLSLATTVTQIVLILINTLNNAWAPWMYDCISSGASEKAVKTFRVYIWGITLLAALVMLAAPELVLILGGSKYESTVWLVPSFIFSCLLSMITNQYLYLETYYKDVWGGGVMTLVLAVVNLPLCWLFIEVFGFGAVGYANALSNVFLIIAHKVLVFKRLKVNDIFSWKVILPPILIAAALMPMCLVSYMFDVAIFRWAAIAALCVAVLVVILKSKKKLPIKRLR
mgnify:CR=1 FL=1